MVANTVILALEAEVGYAKSEASLGYTVKAHLKI